MEKPRILINKSKTDYAGIINLAAVVHSRMSDNEYFPDPPVTMEALHEATIAARKAQGRWGLPRNRGASKDLVELRECTATLMHMLKTLAKYVERIADNALGNNYLGIRVVISTSGFSIKPPKKKQGPLEPVTYFHRKVSGEFSVNEVEIVWKKPRNLVSASNLKEYIIYRGETPQFSQAMLIGRTRICKFRDINLTGVAVKWFYFVVPVGPMGNGVVAGPLQVHLFPGDEPMKVV